MSGNEWHYYGQEIVEEGSYFRKIPAVIDFEQKLRFSSFTYSSDIIRSSWCTMRDLAAQIGEKLDAMPAWARTTLLSSAWTIVDHLNNIRQLINNFYSNDDDIGPISTQLIEGLESVRILRNKMDHLNQNIPNIAKQKGSASAVFGALSYFMPNQDGKSGFIFLHHFGPSERAENWPLLNPAGRKIAFPADHFQLSAFGETIEFGPVIAMLVSWLKKQDEHFAATFPVQAKKVAEDNAIALERLTAPVNIGTSIALAMAFGTAEDIPDPIE